jgi:hypothetical protein
VNRRSATLLKMLLHSKLKLWWFKRVKAIQISTIRPVVWQRAAACWGPYKRRYCA